MCKVGGTKGRSAANHQSRDYFFFFFFSFLPTPNKSTHAKSRLQAMDLEAGARAGHGYPWSGV